MLLKRLCFKQALDALFEYRKLYDFVYLIIADPHALISSVRTHACVQTVRADASCASNCMHACTALALKANGVAPVFYTRNTMRVLRCKSVGAVADNDTYKFRL